MECLEEIKTTTKLATFKSNLKTMAFYLCFPPVHQPLREKKKVGVKTRDCRGVEAGGKMEMWISLAVYLHRRCWGSVRKSLV